MASLGRVEFGTIEVVAHMPRCRDCKWWLGNKTRTQGMCQRISDPDCRVTPLPYIDATGWLHTPPDFGCVMFEAKP